ncbi:hypothetical protein RJ640_029465 [Escallonia rubra]|uniref:Peptidase C1A papain C-terminal domain-containing protein n=1 Tax=Escallonia rubra TaxID=112253 RepID=A0AA88U919_9ASTE|nr:hypothetical protein RJ640_029465 [Escallonia rubra]
MRLEKFYPFIAELQQGQLKDPDDSPKIFIEEFDKIDHKNKEKLTNNKGALASLYPKYGSLFQLVEGIFEEPLSKKVEGRHGFIIVGQRVQDGAPYYKIRNSYSENWGEDGYGKIS